MDSLVQKSLRRATRTLFIFSALSLVLAVVAIVLTTLPYFLGKFTGPTVMTDKEIVSAQVNFVQPLYFREVTGEEMFDTGYEEYTYDSDTGRRVSTDAYFGALYIGSNRFLLVRTPDAIDESRTTYVGSLREIPGDVQREVVDELIRELGGNAQEFQFVPVMLDTSDNEIMWYVGTAIVLAMLLFGLWGVFQVIQRTRDPHNHPAVKKLGRYGDVAMVMGEIESEMNMAEAVGSKRLHITRNWIISTHAGNFQATRLSDLVWLHKHSVRSRYGTQHFARFYDRHGNIMGVQGRRSEDADQMLQAVYDRAPWAIAGYNNELNKAWNKEREQMIAAVDQRKAQLRAGTA